MNVQVAHHRKKLQGQKAEANVLNKNLKYQVEEPVSLGLKQVLTQVAHHRKKLQGRKLDYDCKKRKQMSGGQVPDKEIKQVSIQGGQYITANVTNLTLLKVIRKFL